MNCPELLAEFENTIKIIGVKIEGNRGDISRALSFFVKFKGDESQNLIKKTWNDLKSDHPQKIFQFFEDRFVRAPLSISITLREIADNEAIDIVVQILCMFFDISINDSKLFNDLNLSLDATKFNGHIQYWVKFKLPSNADQDCEEYGKLFDATVVNSKFPDLVWKFYQENIHFGTNDGFFGRQMGKL